MSARIRTGFALLGLLLSMNPSVAESFDIGSGATWTRADEITAPGVNGVVRIKENVASVTIGPGRIADAYRAVESTRGSRLSNARIIGIRARNLQRDGIRLVQAEDVEISNFKLAFRDEAQVKPHLPTGIAIQSGARIVIRDGEITGFRMSVPEGSYPNGDGIATESDVEGLSIERVVSRGNGDAGFDLKGRGIVVDQLTAIANLRSFRFWGEARARTITSVDGQHAVWIGKQARVTIDKLVARSRAPAKVIVIDGANARLEIRQCDLTGMAPGSTLIVRPQGARVVLGPGCALR